jgi:phosphoglycerate dehydrogenase-like enzyme
VNHACGPLCDNDALYQAVESGHHSGAMVVILAVEPVPVEWSALPHPDMMSMPYTARALAGILARIGSDANVGAAALLPHPTPEQDSALNNWDAGTCRQSRNAS